MPGRARKSEFMIAKLRLYNHPPDNEMYLIWKKKSLFLLFAEGYNCLIAFEVPISYKDRLHYNKANNPNLSNLHVIVSTLPNHMQR